VELPRQARWAVPAGAVAAVGLVIAGSVLARAQSTPVLPARTTAQLLAAVDGPATTPPAMTAVVQETASLGLPDLPGSSDPLSALSLLSGAHTFKIWYDGPGRVRVAVPVSMGETDLRLDGSSAWLWNSQTNQATHYLLPAGSGPAGSAPAGPLAGGPAGTIPTPQQLARQVLAAAGPTTTVGLQQNVTVAGQAAYQLSLAPKDSRSLIGQVRVAIDAKDSLPLQVQVFARGASGPAFSVGYSSLSFAVPAASNFTFSPPPGAKVKTVTVPAGSAGTTPIPVGAGGGNGNSSTFEIVGPNGSGTASGSEMITLPAPGQALPPAAVKQIEASFAKSLPATLSTAQRASLLKQFAASVAGKPAGHWAGTPVAGASAPPQPGTHSSSQWLTFSSSAAANGSISGASSGSALPLAAPRVMGKGWLAVAVLPGQFTAGGGFLPKGGNAAVVPGVLGAIASAATPVHGAWGSGRLLRTSLLSVLMTDNGAVLIGAVVPSVLYADAAQLG
jgi:hypothetical protein